LALLACGDTADIDSRGADAGHGDADGGDAGTDSATATNVRDAAATAPADDGGRKHEPPPPFEQSRYVEDLEFVTGERTPGSDHWQAVQDACAERFEALGLDVERETYATGTNVVGTLVGSSQPDELVIIGAHYDHIAGCPGADDNATGVAGLFELGRMLAGGEYARTLLLACWDEEEGGLIGSMAHAQALAASGAQMQLAISLEMIGYRSDEPDSQMVPAGFDLVFPEQVQAVEAAGYRGDFIALIGNEGTAPALRTAEDEAAKLDLKTIVLEADASLGPILLALLRSDHASFWARGVPSLMVTDTANYRNRAYHCQDGVDSIDRLDHEFAGAVVSTMAAMLQVELDR
jgi:Zn-dependent M28 family amino/carboxypeptidase